MVDKWTEQARQSLLRATCQTPGHEDPGQVVKPSLMQRRLFSSPLISDDSYINGGFTPNQEHCWIFQGNRLQLYQNSDGMVIRSWNLQVLILFLQPKQISV